jgi:hypothetical protein
VRGSCASFNRTQLPEKEILYATFIVLAISLASTRAECSGIASAKK